MKIDSSSKSIGSLPSAASTRAGSAATARAENAAATAGAEQASTVVSTNLHTVAGTEPSFNSAKVAEIRQAISEGRFQINPERIADGLISSVREMLARGQRSA